MQDAIDRRDRAHENWLAATLPAEIEKYRSEMKDQDDQASSYHTLGWVGAGVGAALVVGGLVVMVLLPDGDTTARREIAFRPVLLPEGGGMVLEWSW
jgi:hypothetical protein